MELTVYSCKQNKITLFVRRIVASTFCKFDEDTKKLFCVLKLQFSHDFSMKILEFLVWSGGC